ncbi:MAG: SMC-Scp complex subunit ScpB [Spirochaetales bacterium]|nr:SMC-Scp complex subunit ScpB [Spirochaetales bacterium]
MSEKQDMDIINKQTALVEAVLFLENEPLTEEFLARVTGIPKQEIKGILDRIKEVYEADVHGVQLLNLAGGYFFSPKEELLDILRPRYGKRNEGRLSRAALETLAIIAYSQPITRSEIESIRGVGADSMIKLLASKNMIKEVGKKDVPGHPLQYGTTKEFLMFFKLSSISDLPKLDEVEQERFELR